MLSTVSLKDNSHCQACCCGGMHGLLLACPWCWFQCWCTAILLSLSWNRMIEAMGKTSIIIMKAIHQTGDDCFGVEQAVVVAVVVVVVVGTRIQ